MNFNRPLKDAPLAGILWGVFVFFMPKKQQFHVYKLYVGDLFYYGYTHSVSKRLDGHQRKIKNLLKAGLYCLDSIPGYLRIHILAARYLAEIKIKNRLSMADCLCKVHICSVFSSSSEDLSMEVEQFLISKSIGKLGSCNARERAGGKMSCLIKHR